MIVGGFVGFLTGGFLIAVSAAVLGGGAVVAIGELINNTEDCINTK
jgi:hypothetical protein